MESARSEIAGGGPFVFGPRFEFALGMNKRTLAALILFLVPHALYAVADREAAQAVVVIPVAGTVSGANGTRFQTDLTIAAPGNGTGQPSLIDVYWLPQDREGSATPITRLVLPYQATRFYEDFVTNQLHESGLGAIVLQAVNEDGTLDLRGNIDAFARVWTRVPNGPGTTSQSIYGSTRYSPKIDDFQPIPGRIYGLRQDANFRTNVGLVNLSDQQMTITVAIAPDSGTGSHFEVSLLPRSMTQRPLPSGSFGPLTLRLSQHQHTPPSFNLGRWTAYGSSIDNTTGDAWYSKMQAEYLHQECREP